MGRADALSEIDLPRLRASIERHEGRRRRPYHDSEGILTVGVGHNLEPEILGRMYSDSEIDAMLDADIAWAANSARSLVTDAAWMRMGPTRRNVLIEMVFQLGGGGVACFRRFREALECGDYEWAAGEMLWRKWRRGLVPEALRHTLRKSLWRTQTAARCERLAAAMQSGSF